MEREKGKIREREREKQELFVAVVEVMVEVGFDVFVVAVDNYHCSPFQNIFAFKNQQRFC